ncbi:MAG: hypothetical protein HYR67_08165 [Bacteroidetes bacterium]|nr:hypothetical protein [Bacteroidota bacterium]
MRLIRGATRFWLCYDAPEFEARLCREIKEPIHQMSILKSTIKYVTPLILLAVFVCRESSGNLVVDEDLVVKHQLISGTLSSKDTTARFEFRIVRAVRSKR